MSDDLPPILDVRDALDDIETSADADVGDDLDAIRARLDELDDRGRADDQSVVDDIDGLVLGLRESLDGEADRRAEGVQNRLRTYRDALHDASTTLSLSGAELRDGSGDRAGVVDHAGETVDLVGTLVNGGDARAAVVSLAFHDNDGAPVRKVESHEVGLDSDERRDVELTVYVPENTAYYATTALDADDPRATSDTDAPDGNE